LDEEKNRIKDIIVSLGDAIQGLYSLARFSFVPFEKITFDKDEWYGWAIELEESLDDIVFLMNTLIKSLLRFSIQSIEKSKDDALKLINESLKERDNALNYLNEVINECEKKIDDFARRSNEYYDKKIKSIEKLARKEIKDAVKASVKEKDAVIKDLRRTIDLQAKKLIEMEKMINEEKNTERAKK